MGLIKKVLGAWRSSSRTIVSPIRSSAATVALEAVAAIGPVWVELLAVPFLWTPTETAAAINAALARVDSGMVLHFATDRSRAPRSDIRVVLAFNPLPSVTPEQLAAGQAACAESSEQVRFMLVLANGINALASVEGWGSPKATPGTTAFSKLLRQAVRDLIQAPN